MIAEHTHTRTAARSSVAGAHWKDRLINGSALVALIVLALIWILPLIWALETALKPESETATIPIRWIPSHFTLNAFGQVLSASALPRWYLNSAITATVITVATVLLASMAAYAFSRISFPGRGLLYGLTLAGLMVPLQVLIVPLFSVIGTIHLVDTYWGIILPQIAAPIAVFILKQFFDGIPRELEEAALVDGASRLRIYWQIWLPLARPAIAAVGIFTFVGAWNNFLWPLIVATGTDMMTIPVGLATVQTSFGIHYAQIMASAVLAAVPILIVVAIFQSQIVEGISRTGLTGS